MALAADAVKSLRLRSTLVVREWCAALVPKDCGVPAPVRAVVVPDAADLGWDSIERLRQEEGPRMARRLVREMLTYSRSGDLSSTVATWSELAEDVEHLLWPAMADEVGETGRVVVLRLGGGRIGEDHVWTVLSVAREHLPR